MNHKKHYEKQGIDTFKRAEANMTKEEIQAICKFNIDRYNWRSKGQDADDIKKMRDYLDLWERNLDGQEKAKG